ncbi:ATP-binding protein [Burkholderia pseudomallei]|uniref:ATP-binding protein n=1 Tax=Burkholderia pseudomallei TaxID=28450 RepID=UPI001F5D0B68|nr:ATP-binding protein [Burkholderia pseudomallei]
MSLAAALTRMLALLEMSLDDAQLRAELTGDARASVDPSLFGRAMTNLLINAIQHTHAVNTIRATITPRGETVEIAVFSPASRSTRPRARICICSSAPTGSSRRARTATRITGPACRS